MSNPFTAALEAIAAIPQIIDAIRDLTSTIQKMSDEAYHSRLDEAVTKYLADPKIPQAKKDAANEIQKLIHNL